MQNRCEIDDVILLVAVFRVFFFSVFLFSLPVTLVPSYVGS